VIARRGWNFSLFSRIRLLCAAGGGKYLFASAGQTFFLVNGERQADLTRERERERILLKVHCLCIRAQIYKSKFNIASLFGCSEKGPCFPVMKISVNKLQS
jgi:hypothetical protein